MDYWSIGTMQPDMKEARLGLKYADIENPRANQGRKRFTMLEGFVEEADPLVAPISWIGTTKWRTVPWEKGPEEWSEIGTVGNRVALLSCLLVLALLERIVEGLLYLV